MKLVDIIVKWANEFEMLAHDLDDAKDPIDEASKEIARHDNRMRQRRYLERQRLAPSAPFIERERGAAEGIRGAKHSGSLDGLTILLGQQIATKKNEIRKKLIREGVRPEEIQSHPAIMGYEADAVELYAVRDLLKKLATKLRFVETERPLAADQETISKFSILVRTTIGKFGRTYPAVSDTLQQIVAKLESLIGIGKSTVI